MSICFKCEKKEVCLIKGIKEHCNEVKLIGDGPLTIIHGGRASGKSLQLIEKITKMLEESHDNADRMIKLMDEMELQQDKLLIENEELKSQLNINQKSTHDLVSQFDDLIDEYPQLKNNSDLIPLCSTIYIQCAMTNGFFKDGE